jgi:Flp pilus assembly protein TadD
MRTLLASLLLSGLALADVVHLKSGGKIEGKVTDKGEKLEVENANGKFAFAKEDVERIEKKPYELKGQAPKKSNVKLGPTYAHPFYAFKIWLPPKWARGKEQGSTNVSFYGPKEQAYTPRMDLRIEISKKDFMDYVQQYKDAFKKAFKEVLFLYEEASGVRGRVGYQFCVTFSEGEALIKQQALFTFVGEGERRFVLSFNCTQAWFDKFYGQVDASMKSLRLYEMPTCTQEEKQQFLQAYNKAEAAYRDGKFAEAQSGFEEAARLIPQYGEIHTTLGTVHMKQNRFPEAEAGYRKAIELDPDDATPHYNLGVCLLKQSKYEKAVDALKKATELEPNVEPALTNLGVAYLGRDLNDPARQTLEKAVQVDPESAPAHYNLGLAYERLDRKKDAEREFKEAISADSNHEDAKKALERVRGKK